MGFSQGAAAFAIVATAIVLSGCGGGSSPSPRDPVTDAPLVPGAIAVNGSERLAWSQMGDVPNLRFVAYVDGNPVSLEAAGCSGAPEADCSAPLPPLTTGVHTIAVAAISAAGLEGPRSDAITVQKTATRSIVSAVSFPDARASSAAAGLESTVAISGGLTFAADVVARTLKAPMQLASTPDGRLFIATADGLVHLVHPGEPDRTVTALDARALLEPPPAGPLAVALHAEFARNRFVYVSFLAEDGPGRSLFRIVRLREAGETLGEPATLFEAPVVASHDTRRGGVGDEVTRDVPMPPGDAGPRLSVGPDGLLYALLPPGLEFHNEPAASRPHASMVRLQDDGRMPAAGPLSGITAHPLGFTWHPATAALWMILPSEDGAVVVRPVTGGGGGADDPGHAVLRMGESRASSAGALVIQDAPTSLVGRPGPFATELDPAAAGVIRLLVPVLADSLLTGISGRITDVVATGGGTLFLAASSAKAPAGGAADTGDVVMRLRLR